MLASEAEFRAACQAYLSAAQAPPRAGAGAGAGAGALLGQHSYAQGWRWTEVSRPYRAPAGHLVRELNLPWPHGHVPDDNGGDDDDDDDDDDEQLVHVLEVEEEEDAACSDVHTTPVRVVVRVEQSIAYSTTWRVPIMYFRASIQDGLLERPLQLEELLASPVFVAAPLDVSASMAAPDAATFAALSQTDHPLTGLPCFYLHPCQTAARMAELQPAVPPAPAPDDVPARYMSTFLALHATALQLRTA